MWAAYLKDSSIVIPERDDLLTRFPTPAEHSTFYLFVAAHPNPVDAIDATEMTTEDLISLIDTHTSPNAVHITKAQATEIYNLLKPDLDTPT